MLKSTQLALGLCKRLPKPAALSSFTYLISIRIDTIEFNFVFFLFSLLKSIPFGGTALFRAVFIRVFLDVEFIVAVGFFFSIDCTLELCDYSICLLEVCAPHSIAQFSVFGSVHVYRRARTLARASLCV